MGDEEVGGCGDVIRTTRFFPGGRLGDQDTGCAELDELALPGARPISAQNPGSSRRAQAQLSPVARWFPGDHPCRSLQVVNPGAWEVHLIACVPFPSESIGNGSIFPHYRAVCHQKRRAKRAGQVPSIRSLACDVNNMPLTLWGPVVELTLGPFRF